MSTTKVLLITYSTEDEPEDWNYVRGINTYIIDATEVDIQHLQYADQMWMQDCFNSDNELTRQAGYYISHRMGDELLKKNGFVFTEEEKLALFKKEDFGKWIDCRRAGVNDCEGVKKYFSIDLSYDRVF